MAQIMIEVKKRVEIKTLRKAGFEISDTIPALYVIKDGEAFLTPHSKEEFLKGCGYIKVTLAS